MPSSPRQCFDPVPDAVVIGVEVEEVWLAVVVGIEGQGGEVAVSGFEGVGDGVAVGIVILQLGRPSPSGSSLPSWLSKMESPSVSV